MECPGMVITLCLLLTGTASAEVYRWKDEQGRVHFGDRDREGAERIETEVHTVTTVTVETLDRTVPDHSTSGEEVLIYTTQWCGYCKKAKRYFRSNDIPFTEKDIEASEQARAAYEEHGGTGGVPLIVHEQRTMRGFSAKRFERFYED